MWFFIMLSLLLLASTNEAVGASIYYIQPVKSIDDYYLLQIEGNIESGDYDKIVKIIKKNPDKFILNRSVFINSNGGNIIEAVKIGELFKKTYRSVEVKGVCASSCFFIYLGAVERQVIDNSKVGIHRPYFPKELYAGMNASKAELVQNKMMAQVRKYLSDNFVPQNLLDIMFSKSSVDIYWLTDYDIEAIGFNPIWYEEYFAAKCNYRATTLHDIERESR